jgi:hypothetical protein
LTRRCTGEFWGDRDGVASDGASGGGGACAAALLGSSIAAHAQDAGKTIKITVLSAVVTAFAGAVYCQYQVFISPDTVSGIAVCAADGVRRGCRRALRAARADGGGRVTILLGSVLKRLFRSRVRFTPPSPASAGS